MQRRDIEKTKHRQTLLDRFPDQRILNEEFCPDDSVQEINSRKTVHRENSVQKKFCTEKLCTEKILSK